MAAMLQEPNNKSYLLKNKIDFRREMILLFPDATTWLP